MKKALCCAIILIVSGCVDNRYSLDVNFSARPQWRYSADIAMNGLLANGAAPQHFNSRLKCVLDGRADTVHRQSIVLTSGEISVSTNFLDTVETEHVRKQCTGRSLTISLEDGSIVAADQNDIPSINVGRWDIVKSFAKAIPSLPGKKVRVGESWERERQVPLPTRCGNGTGNLFQKFVLDSIFINNNAQWAAISWKFTYRLDLPEIDSVCRNMDFPMSGTGTGVARIDLDKKMLMDAAVTFSAPGEQSDSLGISWTEEATLSLIE